MPRTAPSVDDLLADGLSPAEAAKVAAGCRALAELPPDEAWFRLAREILRPTHPWPLHERCHAWAYREWPAGEGPPPLWKPTATDIAGTHLGRWMGELDLASVAEFHARTVRERAWFWGEITRRLGIHWAEPYRAVVDDVTALERARWFVGGRLNIVESCFSAPADQLALVADSESDHAWQLSYGELRALVERVARGLRRWGLAPGDRVAMVLPLSGEAVVLYLAVLWAGGVVVGIADSLAALEIERRCAIAGPRWLVTQDYLLRGGRELPLADRVLAPGSPPALVLAAEGPGAAPLVPPREGDLTWERLLAMGDASQDPRAGSAEIVTPDAPLGLLFSSGTTGDPKAIPWTHATPIKCAADAWLHCDVEPDDRVSWPTGLGWMMGPWVIFASLINRATLAVFDGAPTGAEFTRFVARSGITLLGVVPSLVARWRETGALEGVDWTGVRRFATTGECSRADDMRWLMSRAGYRPVIEYCGGTELGGGYIGGTLVEPCRPATFTTPAFGFDLVLVDEQGRPAERGEVLLAGPSVGMSTSLANADHHRVYYADVPRVAGRGPLRRHGDYLERLPDGGYRAHGRIDDAMNLGGIKVSSAEIEAVLSTLAGVQDCAAVAVPPPGGGPDRLVVVLVPREGYSPSVAAWHELAQLAIRTQLSPLFAVERLMIRDVLPRTASNKLLRRVLRDELLAEQAG